MAFGDNECDTVLRDAWRDFCSRLADAGESIFRDPAPADAFERVTGFHYASRLIPAGLLAALEHRDPLFPQFFRIMSPERKWGGDNPDCLYLRSAIDGRHTYRIVGHRGDAAYAVITVQEPMSASAAGNVRGTELLLGKAVGQMLAKDLQVEWDGSFELVLSPEEHAGNWIRTTPETDTVLIRQFFGAWHRESPMTVRIERVGGEGAPPAPTPEGLAHALREAAEIVPTTIEYWRDWHQRFREHPNRFISSVTQAKHGAGPGGILLHCGWFVEPDEVMVIRLQPPERCDYWEMEMDNYWMASPDYRYRLVSTNSHHAIAESDGSVVAVLAHDDPGVPNWIDASGHKEGHLTLRWMQVDEAPVPDVAVVKRAELSSALPGDARRIDEAGRREQLRLRRIGVDRRFRV